MATFFFFLGCIAFFGIPAFIVWFIADSEESQKTRQLRNDFLTNLYK